MLIIRMLIISLPALTVFPVIIATLFVGSVLSIVNSSTYSSTSNHTTQSTDEREHRANRLKCHRWQSPLHVQTHLPLQRL